MRPGLYTCREQYEALEAPQGKDLVWFENSAHVTYAEEPDIFDQQMLPVLDETYTQGR
jgi:pimeloyl-ACP methyl ester carboxylesterase